MSEPRIETDAGGPARLGRRDRLLDVVALVLIVIGVGTVVFSHLGMQRLATQPIVVRPGEWAIAQFARYREIELGGYAIAGAGVVAGIASYLLHSRRREAASDRNPAS